MVPRDEWEDFVHFLEKAMDDIAVAAKDESKNDLKTTPSPASVEDDPPAANVHMNKDGTYTTSTSAKPVAKFMPDIDGEKDRKQLPRFVEKIRLVDSNGEKSCLFVTVDDNDLIHVGYTYDNNEGPMDYFLDLNWQQSQFLRGMLEHAENAALSEDLPDTE